jgi:FtsP/CotA-like multicopper oxidase with cupredoxin domain
MVNTANGRVFSLDFGDLPAEAIAVDGMYAAHPFDPSSFELSPGNRLDLDIRLRPEDRGRSFDVVNRFTRRPFAVARIRVMDDAPVATPDFASLARAQLPDWSDEVGREPHLIYRLGARRGGPYGIEWTLNGAVYGQDQQPTLPQEEWVKLRYVNESARLHPMHMHGVFFRVLARNGVAVDEPFWRDTVLVHARETVDIALVPRDEGRWALHCHILEHAEAGMMTVFEVLPFEARWSPGGQT